MTIPTNTATIELQHIASELADYRLVVKVYDDLGFCNERHVWHGTDRAEGERVSEAIRKAFGAVGPFGAVDTLDVQVI